MLTKVHGDVDLSDWTLETVDKLTERITDAIQGEAMRLAAAAIDVSLEQAEVYFAETSDSAADPLELHLCFVGLARNRPPIQNDDSLVYRFNLRDVVQDCLDECGTDGSYSTELGRISDALKTLVGQIDAARERQA